MFSRRYCRFIANFNYFQTKQQSLKSLLSTTTTVTTSLQNECLKRLLSTQLKNDGKLIIVSDAKAKSDATASAAVADSIDLKCEMKFPTVWLRDNCQCSECFHDTTKSRKINWERCNNETSIRAVQVTVAENENAIIVDWQDAHKSKYDLKWLKQRDFSPQQRKKYIDEVYKPKEIMWSKQDYKDALKIYDFQKIIANDLGKVKVLLNFITMYCLYCNNSLLIYVHHNVHHKCAKSIKIYLMCTDDNGICAEAEDSILHRLALKNVKTMSFKAKEKILMNLNSNQISAFMIFKLQNY